MDQIHNVPDKKKKWTLEIILIVLLGPLSLVIPYSFLIQGIAWLVSCLCFLLQIKIFGRGSAIEMFVATSVLLVLTGVILRSLN